MTITKPYSKKKENQNETKKYITLTPGIACNAAPG